MESVNDDAVVDLLVAAISVTTDIIWRITVHWYAGAAMCKIVRYLQVRALYTYSCSQRRYIYSSIWYRFETVRLSYITTTKMFCRVSWTFVSYRWTKNSSTKKQKKLKLTHWNWTKRIKDKDSMELGGVFFRPSASSIYENVKSGWLWRTSDEPSTALQWSLVGCGNNFFYIMYNFIMHPTTKKAELLTPNYGKIIM